MIGVVIDNVSPKVLQEVVSSEEKDLWVQHVTTILERLTQDPRWIRTGVLVPHDQRMLDALTPTVKHYAMLQRMNITITTTAAPAAGGPKFLRVLANFIRARRAPQLPCAEVTDQICAVTGNILVTLQRQYRQQFLQSQNRKPMSSDDAAATEQAFRPLEESGLLAQTLRCVTVPPECMVPEVMAHRLYFLDELLQVSIQMRRKLTPTSPTGTVLQAILNGKDGHSQCRPEILQRLKSLAQICEYATPPVNHLNSTTGGASSTLQAWTCRFCNKSGSSRELLLCSRCKGESRTTI